MIEQTIPQPDVSTADTIEQMGQEQAADLARLQALAGEGEAQATQAAEQAQAQAAINQVDELTGIIFTAGNILSVKFPSLGKVYTEERSRSVAQNLNPVFERLGWNISGGDFAMWVGAVVAVGMLAKDTKEAIKVDIDAQRIEAENAQKAAAGMRQEE